MTASQTKIEHEAARVAAAFGVTEWDSQAVANSLYCKGTSSEILEFSKRMCWDMKISGSGEHVFLDGIAVQDGDFWKNLDGTFGLYFRPDAKSREFMARGLYRLGLEKEDFDIANQLPEITAHEKLELRLTLPREFWPEKWKEEAGN